MMIITNDETGYNEGRDLFIRAAIAHKKQHYLTVSQP